MMKWSFKFHLTHGKNKRGWLAALVRGRVEIMDIRVWLKESFRTCNDEKCSIYKISGENKSFLKILSSWLS